MSAVELLKKTREILTPPDAWIQGNSAAVRKGDQIERLTVASDVEANCFCLIGAFDRASNLLESSSKTRQVARELICQHIDSFWISAWNDKPIRKHEQVIKMLDKAIKKAEGRRQKGSEQC